MDTIVTRIAKCDEIVRRIIGRDVTLILSTSAAVPMVDDQTVSNLSTDFTSVVVTLKDTISGRIAALGSFILSLFRQAILTLLVIKGSWLAAGFTQSKALTLFSESCMMIAIFLKTFLAHRFPTNRRVLSANSAKASLLQSVKSSFMPGVYLALASSAANSITRSGPAACNAKAAFSQLLFTGRSTLTIFLNAVSTSRLPFNGRDLATSYAEALSSKSITAFLGRAPKTLQTLRTSNVRSLSGSRATMHTQAPAFQLFSLCFGKSHNRLLCGGI